MTEETKDVSVDEAAQAALLLDDAIAERLLNIIKTRPEMALALATALDKARYEYQMHQTSRSYQQQQNKAAIYLQHMAAKLGSSGGLGGSVLDLLDKPKSGSGK